jgi:hypothetical protein
MTIRVLLGTTTAMVRSALHGALAECEDIELVPSLPSDPLPADIDVVVVHRAAMRDCPPVLRAIVDAPHIGVVAISEDGAAGSLHRIDRRGWLTSPADRHGLADAIRAVAKPV